MPVLKEQAPNPPQADAILVEDGKPTGEMKIFLNQTTINLREQAAAIERQEEAMGTVARMADIAMLNMKIAALEKANQEMADRMEKMEDANNV